MGQTPDNLLAELGPHLSKLVREWPVRLREHINITRLVCSRGTSAVFALNFADGTRLKGRRLKSAERARQVEQILRRAGEGFSRILARSGNAMLLEWVEGSRLEVLRPLQRETLVRSGELLGKLHRLASGPIGAPLPSLDDLLGRLHQWTGSLVEGGWLDAEQGARAIAIAEVAPPPNLSGGIVHMDFCPQNLVLHNGLPVCIDNVSMGLGLYDHDLARTWYRWFLTGRALTAFHSGYQRYRSIDTWRPAFRSGPSTRRSNPSPGTSASGRSGFPLWPAGSKRLIERGARPTLVD